MSLLLVKLLVTPALVGGISLFARRWGPALAGWLVALPLTSGPVVTYVALEHGVPFGVEVGLGVVSGGFGLCAYAITYSRVSGRFGAFTSCGIATLAFLACGLVVDAVDPRTLTPIAIGVATAMLAAILFVPSVPAVHGSKPPTWDLPARVLVGTTIVVGISALAPVLGARVSGLAATYPVYVSTLTVFAHRQDGPGAASALLRGLVLGLYGWLGFFVVLLVAMPMIGVLPAFGAAVAGALTIQGVSLHFMRDALTPAVREAAVNESVP
jgi:hypothetical protein